MLKVAWAEDYAHPLPNNHRFPMIKYELLPEQLLYEGTLSTSNIFGPTRVEESLIMAAHSGHYWQKLKNLELTKSEIRRTVFPLSKQLVDRETLIMSGTIQCAMFALKYGISMNVAGGTHHAFSDRGEGFCLLNDIAVASYYLLNNGHVRKILVVDLDVHQGNGTAEIFKDESRVFTFSMHGANNYPLHKENSDLDIGLADGTDDAFYLKTLEINLKNLLERVEPEFIFFLSGVDVLATDKLGRLGLTLEGCKSRDKMVLDLAKENDIPLVASMGGGYSEDIKVIIEAHANTYRLAQEIYF